MPARPKPSDTPPGGSPPDAQSHPPTGSALSVELPQPVPVVAPAIVDAIAVVPDEHRADYAELIRTVAAANRGITAAAEGLCALRSLSRSDSGRELLTARGIDAEAVAARLLDLLTPRQSAQPDQQ